MAKSDLSLGDILGPLLGFGGPGKAKEAPRTVNPLFDREFYAANNPHVVKGGIDLHDHYSYFGCRNGYDPNPYFRSAWYLAENRDVAETGANPLDHYLERGAIEGRDPSPDFSTWLYLIFYPDVRATGMNPLLHFLQHGKAEGRRAPPIYLVPSLGTMVHTSVDEFDPATLAAGQPWILCLRDWCARLLDRAEGPAARGPTE